MYIAIVTVFPEMFIAVTQFGVIGRAVKDKRLNFEFYNPRSFAEDSHKTVDDKPFGGGPGMLMKTGPLVAAIRAAKAGSLKRGYPNPKVYYLSPQGKAINQSYVESLAGDENLILVCGRYQGIDERVILSEIDGEISLGDFVLSGGEVAAMALVDALGRCQPDVLGDVGSLNEDSFSNGLLHCPEYTRPGVFEGCAVPEILLSGHHEAIKEWREEQSLKVTWEKRPDLLEAATLSKKQETQLRKIKVEADKKK
jgi:tRNA (guanine37-N1)-methyltransferase